MTPRPRRHLPDEALTLDDYRALDAAGQIARPLTDSPIGATTFTRRYIDARNSELVTDHTPPRTPKGPPDISRGYSRHGTDAGYQAHRKRGEPPCPACRTAHASAVRDRKARRTT